MITGTTQSADGGYRRIPLRRTKIVDEETRSILVTYLQNKVYQQCEDSEWVGCRDIFPNLPDDLVETPLNVIYELCREKFADNPDTIVQNLAKYLGMLVREAVYSSEEVYYEKLDNSVRLYSLASKKLKEDDYMINRKKYING